MLPIALVLVTLLASSRASPGQLSETYYDDHCPKVFELTERVIKNASTGGNDTQILAALLRLQFQDCITCGCDASILLDNSKNIISEKDAFINKRLENAYIVVDKIKAELEKACPRIVSCADIIVLAAQISVKLMGGPVWNVLLGRRDGLKTNKTDADNFRQTYLTGHLDKLKQAFLNKGLNTTDLVALSGAHTVGGARCKFFTWRVFNFLGGGRGSDPYMEPYYGQFLRYECQYEDNVDTVVPLDLTTPKVFDNWYYKNLESVRGLLESDQVLYLPRDNTTKPIVKQFAEDQNAFFRSFVEGMIKMGNIDIIMPPKGEIRQNCRKLNTDAAAGPSGNPV